MRQAILAVLAAVLVTAVPGCSRDGRSSGIEAESAVPFVAVDPASASSTDRAVAVQQTKLQAAPGDGNARLALATLFLQKVRETGDPTFYAKADSLITGLAKSRKNDPGVLIAQASLALGRHEFDEALRLGRRALGLAPANSAALGVIVDASNELGRYEEALEATQAMVDAKPDLASYSRVSYARELRGDLDGAITAMGQAVAAAGRGGENLAYTQVLLGNLLLNKGDLDGAEAAYATAEQAFPGFALPKAGRARLLVARGDTAGAAELLGQVVQVMPTVEHVIAQGDALAALGRTSEADEAYALVRAIGRLNADNGVNVDLEMALFEADHSPGASALKSARKALKNRPGIHGHDVMAWSLFTARKGNPWPEAKKALSLGSRDPLIRYHAAAIAFQRGDREAASENLRIVLATNPRFSPVLSPRVAKLANELGLTPSLSKSG